ncbi:MAG TPA: 16S rRNA (guanine(527)-N(7))-methyltransferase RsmG [bacterium]|nr:16S rRNA (guanine(527)-N(7))-methyltransferase RsmG [bacterium]
MSLTPGKLEESFGQAGLLGYFPPDSLPPLAQFTQRMLQINESLNLTKWTADEDVLIHHLLDSAKVLPLLKPLAAPGQHWLDLGTGCGFPGAVLIAAFPEMKVTLLDSVAKKTKALEECLQAAGWSARAKTLTGRAEELGQKSQTRETWDGLVARAVADLRVVLEYGIPLLKTGGYLVNWMTNDQLRIVDKSTNALNLLHGKIAKQLEYQLPGLEQPRHLVLVEKLGKTPEGYPRAVGKPSKDPL